MNRLVKVFGVLALAVVLAACSSKGGVKSGEQGADGANGAGSESGPQIGTYGEGEGNGAYGSGAGSGQGGAYGADGELTGDPRLDDPNSPLSKRIIYFNYDSSEVLPDYVSVVTAHARFLAENGGKSVTLEGHADERGSPEYNIALGEQRAKAVAKMMQLQGAADGQMQIVSYGEEKPLNEGHDESAYSQNRRVEIVYRRQ